MDETSGRREKISTSLLVLGISAFYVLSNLASCYLFNRLERRIEMRVAKIEYKEGKGIEGKMDYYP